MGGSSFDIRNSTFEIRHSTRLLLAFGLISLLACAPSATLDEQARAVADDEAAPAAERARAHRRLGDSLKRQGQLQEAVARLETAAELFASDPAELAPTLNLLSDVYFRLGDFERQEEVLWRALDHAVAVDDRREAAISWNNLGVSYAARGRPSAALEAYHRCLQLRRDLDDEFGVAVTRHNLGVELLMLGRVDEGVLELRQALEERRRLGKPAGVGQTLASLAWGLAVGGRHEDALVTYAEAVALLDRAGAVHDLAVALEQRSQLQRKLGRFDEARDDLGRAMDLLAASGGLSPFDVAYLHLGLGAVRREQGQVASALPLLREAAQSFDALGAQEGRIQVRLELARALRRRDDGRDEAVGPLAEAIEIIETARSDLRLPSFRATFLGGWQAVYQELVDVLASAAVAEPETPEARVLAARALAVAEKARARSLLDRMATDDTAADRPQPWDGLRDQVEELEARAVLGPAAGSDAVGIRGSTLSSPLAPPEGTLSAEEAREELRRARFALERTQEVSRRAASPSPAARPADVDAILRHLDADTVLLVYSLGPRRSWLWRCDRQGVALIPLPPGPEIEAVARNVHQLLPLHGRRGYGEAARLALARLSRLVLAPVADLGSGRLAVVPDGALHLVPFAALPLAEGYEVVHLPSASTLVELRRRADRAPASRLLAVVADPVFEADDPRLGREGASPLVIRGDRGRIKRSLAGADPEAAVFDPPSSTLARTRRALGGRLGRLPASAEEGSRIVEVARRASGVTGSSPLDPPEGTVPLHQGFDASRELVTGGGLGDVRILHFATHGVADAEDPALAGLVLSLYDAAGRPRDGLLRARDLHGLHLRADLVVLSACRSALGQEVRGEGLVGLADGFFAAGARHLVVSLWDVDDRATAELMVRFYRHLLLDGRRPADALRRSQQELRDETEWRSPAYWAAFVAVGDWGVGGFVAGARADAPSSRGQEPPGGPPAQKFSASMNGRRFGATLPLHKGKPTCAQPGPHGPAAGRPGLRPPEIPLCKNPGLLYSWALRRPVDRRPGPSRSPGPGPAGGLTLATGSHHFGPMLGRHAGAVVPSYAAAGSTPCQPPSSASHSPPSAAPERPLRPCGKLFNPKAAPREAPAREIGDSNTESPDVH